MNPINKHIVLLILFLYQTILFGQEGKYCLDFVREIEDQFYKIDLDNNTVYLHYYSEVTDWENAIVKSDVKIYKNKEKLVFYSDKADIFKDLKEMLLVLRDQKTILRNGAPKDIDNIGYSTEFNDLRTEFFKACVVTNCSKTEKDSIWKLVLKAPVDPTGILFIDKIVYEYNISDRKILSTYVEFRKDYKMKSMRISYLEFDPKSDFKFKNESYKYVFDGSKKAYGKYLGYNIIDNRDK